MFRYLLPVILLVVTTLGAGGVYHACVNDASGIVRLVDGPGLCAAGESYITWGAVGLQGPAGPVGPAGPAGTQGLTGAQGVPGVQGPAGVQGPPGIGDLGCATGQIPVWNDATGVWQCATSPNLAGLQSQVAALQTQVAALTTLLDGVTREQVDGYPVLRLSGLNLQVVNGLGQTNLVNGTGNIVVGYNETQPFPSVNSRTGSHLLILGSGQYYTTYGGIMAGTNGLLQGANGSILGGVNNKVFGTDSVVVGGQLNSIEPLGNRAVIVGGVQNVNEGTNSVVTAGAANFVSSTGYAAAVIAGNGVAHGVAYQWRANNFQAVSDNYPP